MRKYIKENPEAYKMVTDIYGYHLSTIHIGRIQAVLDQFGLVINQEIDSSKKYYYEIWSGITYITAAKTPLKALQNAIDRKEIKCR